MILFFFQMAAAWAEALKVATSLHPRWHNLLTDFPKTILTF